MLVLIIIIGYYINAWLSTFSTTSCALYGNVEGLPGCEAGKAYYGGTCYTDTWSDSGGTKTAVCTVSYPDCYIWGCSNRTYNITADAGTPCNSQTIPGWDDAHFGPGWYVTGTIDAAKYCHRGGTFGVYCENDSIPETCPANADVFEGVCYSGKCPEGQVRSEICTCVPASA